jgi:hypothetical protein
MRRLSLLKLSIVASALSISPCLLAACQCSGKNYYGKSVLDAAKLRAEGAASIFEGQLAKVEVKWDALAAKDGDLVPATIFFGPFGPKGLQTPYVEVTFQVLRAYKGAPGTEARVRTGMGGGDCGAGYAQGLTYLVYASKLSGGELGVSMCSPGGWVGNGELQPDLRYLRKEPPTRSDLAPWVQWDRQEAPKIAEERQRRAKEWQQHYEGATGKICGKIENQKTNGSISGAVYFLPTLGYSHMDPPMAQVGEDGSFCSRQLGPGKYYVYFQGGPDEKHVSAVYYPSSPNQARATPIEVSAGKTQSDLKFKAPNEATYSVRGIIHTNEKPPAGDPGGISIVLVPLDGGPLSRYRFQTIQFDGVLSMANSEYFHLDEVLPGRYAVFAATYADGWLTKRVDVTVSSHGKFTILELIHKK